MFPAIIHAVSFQTGYIEDIRHFPVSRRIQPEGIGTDSFSDAKWAAEWLLKFPGVKI
jgi:hypothetical protein